MTTPQWIRTRNAIEGHDLFTDQPRKIAKRLLDELVKAGRLDRCSTDPNLYAANLDADDYNEVCHIAWWASQGKRVPAPEGFFDVSADARRIARSLFDAFGVDLMTPELAEKMRDPDYLRRVADYLDRGRS